MLGVALGLLVATSTPTLLFQSGEVQLATQGSAPNLWDYQVGWPYTYAADGCILIFKCVAYSEGNFLIPTTGGVVFEKNRTVSFWDGRFVVFTSPDEPSKDIVQDDVDLSEIAPMGNGRFLVAERRADRTRGAKVIEFDMKGRIKDHAFPEVLDADGRALGAQHIELLSDHCTLLYTNGDDDPNGNRVRRMDICTDTAESDFATLVAGEYAGAIRQMPDGSVIVADGDAVLRFTAGGSLMRTYAIAGVTHVALTPDGSGFWAAGANAAAPQLMFFGSGDSVRIGNPEMQPPASADAITDLVVAGEWRAAITGPPRRHATR